MTDKLAQLDSNTCVICKKPFTDKNVFTDAGWRETQITGFCEKCFDEATLDEDGEEI